MQEGYIKLYRCILDSSWSRHPDYMAVWVYCLLRGNYKSADVVTKWGGIVHLDPGQFITSRQQISLNTGVQESMVERILKHFKSEQQIEQENHGKFRIISILNWHKYQASEHEVEQQVNNTRTTDEQQVNTDKKEKKKAKKEEKVKTAEDLSSSKPHLALFPLCQAWKDFVDMRAKINKSMTAKAKELAVNKLWALAKEGHDPIQVLEQSVFNSWQGLFPVKNATSLQTKSRPLQLDAKALSEAEEQKAHYRKLGLIE